MGFIVTIRVCAVMKPIIRDVAENFGEEFFSRVRERDGTTLISKLFNDIVNAGILSGGS